MTLIMLAYENTWKCGELKLHFSPSAGGLKAKKKKVGLSPGGLKLRACRRIHKKVPKIKKRGQDEPTRPKTKQKTPTCNFLFLFLSFFSEHSPSPNRTHACMPS